MSYVFFWGGRWLSRDASRMCCLTMIAPLIFQLKPGIRMIQPGFISGTLPLPNYLMVKLLQLRFNPAGQAFNLLAWHVSGETRVLRFEQHIKPQTAQLKNARPQWNTSTVPKPWSVEGFRVRDHKILATPLVDWNELITNLGLLKFMCFFVVPLDKTTGCVQKNSLFGCL